MMVKLFGGQTYVGKPAFITPRLFYHKVKEMHCQLGFILGSLLRHLLFLPFQGFVNSGYPNGLTPHVSSEREM